MNKFFDPSFLLDLPPDNVDAVLAICGEFARFNSENAKIALQKGYPDYVEALAIVQALADHRNLSITIPTLGPNHRGNLEAINQLFTNLSDSYGQLARERDTTTQFSVKTDEYRNLFEGILFYEFSESDYLRIQELIGELRTLISESQLITADHQRRLLRRLEAMQRELHQKTTDIDRFWGFIGEAGITIRKFGEDIEPVSERVNELGKIVIAVIMAKEGIHALPEIAQFLLQK